MGDMVLNGNLDSRLQQKETQEKIIQLLDKLDTLNEVLDQAGLLIKNAPSLISVAADTMDESYAEIRQKGIDVEARGVRLLSLIEKLTEPNKLEQIEQLVDLSERFPGIISMVADIADETYQDAQSKGIEIEGRIQNALKLADKLTSDENTQKIDDLLELSRKIPDLTAMAGDIVDSEMNDRTSPLAASIFIVQEMGSALGQASCEKRKIPSLFAVIRRVRHPYVRKSLCFLMSFAERLGERLERKRPSTIEIWKIIH